MTTPDIEAAKRAKLTQLLIKIRLQDIEDAAILLNTALTRWYAAGYLDRDAEIGECRGQCSGRATTGVLCAKCGSETYYGNVYAGGIGYVTGWYCPNPNCETALAKQAKE